MIMKGKLVKLYLNSGPQIFPQSRQYQQPTQELSLGCSLAATRAFLQSLNGDTLYDLVEEEKEEAKGTEKGS